MDTERELDFGYFLVPAADEPHRLIETAETLDRLGFDLIGIQDHPYQARFLDTWTLLTTIAARTTRLRIFPDVANLPLRPPAVLAKAAASLDLLTAGRVELGLGAGAFWDAVVAMGGPRRAPADAVAALSEAIEVIRLMWSGDRAARFDGEHYRLAGVHPGPKPAHDIGIWLGAYGPKMLTLVGSKADGWLPSSGYLPPAKLAEATARIDDAAHSAGRDPAEIRRIYTVSGDHEPAHWIEVLTELTLEYGLDGFVFDVDPDPAVLGRLADDVIPAVRRNVAAERPGGGA